jgi:hypothetical protein
MESDAAYFRRRAIEEYLQANFGPPGAFRARREMSVRFAEVADAIEDHERILEPTTKTASISESEVRAKRQVTLWL